MSSFNHCLAAGNGLLDPIPTKQLHLGAAATPSRWAYGSVVTRLQRPQARQKKIIACHACTNPCPICQIWSARFILHTECSLLDVSQAHGMITFFSLTSGLHSFFFLYLLLVVGAGCWTWMNYESWSYRIDTMGGNIKVHFCLPFLLAVAVLNDPWEVEGGDLHLLLRLLE